MRQCPTAPRKSPFVAAITSRQRFHSWIHAKQKLDWPLGIASQLAFNLAVILLAVELQM
jgi:hypothetical protein